MHTIITWWLETNIGPFTMADIAGFATGALCVWLVVRQHVANFPVGIANNIFFFVLFVDVRLYADAGLQVVYLGLAIVGWYWWLRGGTGRTELAVSRAPRRELLWCAVAFVGGCVVVLELLRMANGAAPLVDAATATASLIAQYLLTRKRLESWFVWIAVDIAYVPLYLSRDLPLTALLYLGFIGLCLQGLRSWRASLAETAEPADSPERAAAPTAGEVTSGAP